ncbi:Putative lipoprotein LprJ [Mycobacterium simulans]|uniref:Lipoprotein LprJ n=1 Tax=Mycobacterium simulans TaxID=627089 RepID=A0A7Z7N9A7_9MYCO|nr:DUF732 domain-containing protein [Mycobacterium simulans]SOJ54599.1 Putative lipoprotein LprJ [Mycobacterium simulans]
MRLLLALTGVAVVIGVAAPAHADGTDDGFLAALRQAGLTYETPDGAVTAGKTVCRMADGGKPMAEVVKVVQNANPGLNAENAAKFTAIAANSYCPKALAYQGGNG